MKEGQALTLGTLPPDAKKIIKTKKIRGKKRLSGWLALLKVLSRFDAETDEAYKNAMGSVIASAIISILSFFFLIFGLIFTEGSLIILMIGSPVALFGVIRLIFFGLKASDLKHVDLSNDFRQTLLPLLEALSEDIQPKGKILLDLDMGQSSAKQYKQSETRLPPGKFRKLIETIYEIRCCTASIPLEGGTVLSLDISKKLSSYDRYYTNARGKHKHKKKWKQITLVTTALRLGDEKLSINESGLEELSASEKIRLGGKKGKQLCKLTRKFRFKSPDGNLPEDCLPPEAIIEMYMKICSILNSPVLVQGDK